MFPQSKPHPLEKSRWKPVLLRESLQKDLSDICQKRDLLASEKPVEVAFWRYFSNLQANWENYHFYGNKVESNSVKFLHIRRIATNDFFLYMGKRKKNHVLFALIPQRHLRTFFGGIVDQLILFGIMFRSGPTKILTWQTSLPPHQLFASA